MELNPYQKVAVNHLNGPALVTSIPGSGKTFVLVERVIKLMEKGVNPKNILCITFTNKAAKEMRQRIAKRLGKDKPNFYIGTFHALCSSILRKVGKHVGYESNFTIMNEHDQADLILQIGRSLETDIERGEAYKLAFILNNYRDQLRDLNYVQDKLRNDAFFEIVVKYLEKCEESNLIDFTGLIYKTIQLIEENERIREKIQENFKYIMVDEAQDTNQSQYHLVNLFGAKWKNIMLIGDIDQSIYKFRGAKYDNVLEFLSLYPYCKKMPLSKNYRSTPQIIEPASTLIKRNESHIEIKFETDNLPGQPVRCYPMNSQTEEADWVARSMERLMVDGGWEFRDMAVLYRTNKMSEPIERSLSILGFPYEVIGGWNFYDRREVKDCLAMVKFLANKKDGVSFHRVCSLVKGIGDTTVGRIERKSKENDINLIDACRESIKDTNSVNIKQGLEKLIDAYTRDHNRNAPSNCLTSLVEDFNYENYLSNKYGTESVERFDNVGQVIETAGEFNGQRDGLNKYLQQISLVTKSDKEVEGDRISLMTIHAAKGLEFPIVFLIGVEQNMMPHGRAIAEDPVGNLEEERRLCYVAMTRAKKLLYITYCRSRKNFNKYGNMITRRCRPSQFLFEAGLLEE